MAPDLTITFFVLATNETDLLYKTVCKIKEKCPAENINRIIVVLKSDKCKSYSALQEHKKDESWSGVEAYIQKADSLKDTLSELPPMATGTHFIFISADMEMSPDSITDFIREAKKNPNCIIAASKWAKGSVVEGYGKFAEFCSRTMNIIAGLLIRKKATDLFTIYQIYPVSVYKSMNFNDPKKFCFEYTLRPVRMGVDYKEVPTVYVNDSSKKTNFNVIYRVKYLNEFLFAAFRLGVTPKKYLLRE